MDVDEHRYALPEPVASLTALGDGLVACGSGRPLREDNDIHVLAMPMDFLRWPGTKIKEHRDVEMVAAAFCPPRHRAQRMVAAANGRLVSAGPSSVAAHVWAFDAGARRLEHAATLGSPDHPSGLGAQIAVHGRDESKIIVGWSPSRLALGDLAAGTLDLLREPVFAEPPLMAVGAAGAGRAEAIAVDMDGGIHMVDPRTSSGRVIQQGGAACSAAAVLGDRGLVARVLQTEHGGAWRLSVTSPEGRIVVDESVAPAAAIATSPERGRLAIAGPSGVRVYGDDWVGADARGDPATAAVWIGDEVLVSGDADGELVVKKV